MSKWRARWIRGECYEVHAVSALVIATSKTVKIKWDVPATAAVTPQVNIGEYSLELNHHQILCYVSIM